MKEIFPGLDKRNLFRLPWSMNDNPIAWLEITDICNLACEGCYRQTITKHKTLEQIQEEVLFFKRWRNPDNISIAGGEPLIHPQILDVVSFIAKNGIKPVILTNAQKLTPELLRELKKAGLSGFTFHIDSHQGRPGWQGKSEKEHNQLRQKYADMCAEVGGLYVVFNSTVYPSTFNEIPDIVRWGNQNFSKVNGLVFITYRTATTENNVAINNDKQIVDFGKLSYIRESFADKFVTAPEVHQLLKNNFPEYEPSGYLGGSIRHDTYKWLIGALIGNNKKIYGSVGKETMEISQVGHHIFNRTYLAYLSQAKVGAKVFLMSPWDEKVRQAAKNWFKDMLTHPAHLLDNVSIQSIGIIQAPDILPDGRADMCDSCPDITYFDGKLVNSCRLDEYRLFGGFLTVLDKEKTQEKVDVPEKSS
jgi:MoaA/NifB/PqqE/SkfB family radical SAM enzyme